MPRKVLGALLLMSFLMTVYTSVLSACHLETGCGMGKLDVCSAGLQARAKMSNTLVETAFAPVYFIVLEHGPAKHPVFFTQTYPTGPDRPPASASLLS